LSAFIRNLEARSAAISSSCMTHSLRTKNVEKVAQVLSEDRVWREEFLGALESGDRGLSAVAWTAGENPGGVYEVHSESPSWLPSWIDVAAKNARPGSLPEHDTGAFYILDLSSTFAVAPLGEIHHLGGLLVDVCAAPGGKGILARRYCQPEALIGNEVIRKRTAQLIANYKRCAIDPALVTSVDPKLLGRLLQAQAQVVVVDAPCSGQSLILKGLAAPGAFHPATIAMNERRQRRILAESSKVVRPGGYLLYATCTFSPEENEQNVEWFLKTFPDFAACEVSVLGAFRSHLSDHATYRLYPQQGFGAGAFCCLLRRCDEGEMSAAIETLALPSVIRPVWSSPFFATAVTPSVPLKGSHPSNRTPRKRGQDKRFRRWSGRNAE
jgi:16S rRNA C967 or C1407 C5-methylase (RsmB/RsmF family)